MKIEASSVDSYYENIPEERKPAMNKLRAVINASIPKEFIEALDYGMPGWSVPHSLYPAGYHCNPKIPLPFLGIASQKNFIAVYHMGIYASKPLLDWFVEEFPKHSKRKLDMGKSCIRFKKMEDIPFDLIGELATKMRADEWIELYENNLKR